MKKALTEPHCSVNWFSAEVKRRKADKWVAGSSPAHSVDFDLAASIVADWKCWCPRQWTWNRSKSLVFSSQG
jgi:hypothetical protein